MNWDGRLLKRADPRHIPVMGLTGGSDDYRTVLACRLRRLGLPVIAEHKHSKRTRKRIEQECDYTVDISEQEHLTFIREILRGLELGDLT